MVTAGVAGMMWELRPESLQALDARLAELQPQLMVEAGSGQSTAVMAKHGRVISLEHIPKIAKESRQLAPTAEIRLCKLRPFHTLAGNFRWYDTRLPGRIDFALIDGPPGLTVGRQAALFALWPYLNERWEVWLDDADRPHEQECLTIWQTQFLFHTESVSRSVVRLFP